MLAINLEGDINARLSALEKFYTRMATVGQRKPREQFRDQHNALANCIKKIQNLRLHFDHLRSRYRDEIAVALSGRPSEISLSHEDAILIDSIVDSYEVIRDLQHQHLNDAGIDPTTLPKGTALS
jgi:hypothetical protein